MGETHQHANDQDHPMRAVPCQPHADAWIGEGEPWEAATWGTLSVGGHTRPVCSLRYPPSPDGTQHPPSPPPGFPGPNGLQIFHDEVYVSVPDRGHVVVVPINADGSAGRGHVHVPLVFDDFAFDVKGNLYGMTNPLNGVGHDHKNLYIANGAFPVFPGQTPRRPSVMRLHVGIPGKPRR